MCVPPQGTFLACDVEPVSVAMTSWLDWALRYHARSIRPNRQSMEYPVPACMQKYYDIQSIHIQTL